jgi:hypothetical protein
VDLQAWNLEKLLSVGFDDKNGLKKGGAVGVRDAPSGQPPRKKRKVEDLGNDLAAMTHGEGEEGIYEINANGYCNDNDKVVEGEPVEGGQISGRI